MQAALATIEAHAGPASGAIVFLGDYIDRGPRSADVLGRLVAGPRPGWRWICLKGNHEAIMSVALRDPGKLDWWIDNGGDATIASYHGRRDLIASHLDWIERLDCVHCDAERVYVHAGVEPDTPLAAQSEDTLLWKRYAERDARGHGTRYVIHGHTPDVGGPRVLAGRTALDTLAWRSGRLVVAVFDDAVAGGPIDLLEVVGQPDI